MRLANLAGLAIVGFGLPADAAAHEPGSRSVTACIQGIYGTIPAQAVASRIFDAIGVAIVWRQSLKNCPPEGLIVDLSTNTPAGLRPGSLAYAMPFEGSHIRVFYD